MTTLIERAVSVLERLPAERRDELAQLIIDVEETAPNVERTPEFQAAVAEGLADADAGRFADPKDVDELFDRFR